MTFCTVSLKMRCKWSSTKQFEKTLTSENPFLRYLLSIDTIEFKCVVKRKFNMFVLMIWEFLVIITSAVLVNFLSSLQRASF